jgi:acyl-homoserine lactone acylase PvdQ
MVPNIWYRAVLSYGPAPERRLVGVTLPGTPSLVVGSNGDIAWGFTNTGGDWVDLVELEPNATFAIHRETIAVRGEAEIEIEVRETPWGPIVDRDHRGAAFPLDRAMTPRLIWAPASRRGMMVEGVRSRHRRNPTSELRRRRGPSAGRWPAAS